MASIKPTRTMPARAGDSLHGLAEGWRREGAIRAHVLMSATGLILLCAARPPAHWLVAYALLVLTGLAAELINAAVEALLDRLHPDRDDEIGAAKDLCSAAAFVLNVAAAGAFAGGLLARFSS